MILTLHCVTRRAICSGHRLWRPTRPKIRPWQAALPVVAIGAKTREVQHREEVVLIAALVLCIVAVLAALWVAGASIILACDLVILALDHPGVVAVVAALLILASSHS
jgi:hypothetical protein